MHIEAFTRKQKLYPSRCSRAFDEQEPAARSNLLRPLFLRGVPPSRLAFRAHGVKMEVRILADFSFPISSFLAESQPSSGPFRPCAHPARARLEIWLPREKVQRCRRLLATTSSIPECFAWHRSW